MSKDAIIQSTAGIISFDHLVQALQAIGVNPGDTLFVHASIFTFGRPAGIQTREEFANLFIEAILSVLGNEGTLIVPAFTLSFCKNGLFNSASSEPEVGLLSKVFLRRRGVVRTRHPIYSVAISGKDQDYYSAACTTNCTGEGSIFDLIHRKGSVKILLLGSAIPATTQFHYVEEQAKVPYRRMKTFTGTADSQPVSVEVYVRNVNHNPEIDPAKFAPFFERYQLLKKAKLGDGAVMVIEESEMHRCLLKAFAEDPSCFLKGPYLP